MKLVSVDINNFRSIKRLTIDLEPPCRILVGMNESGKSNILKALSCLAKNSQFDKANKREPWADDEKIDKSDVEFNLVFSEEEIATLINNIILKIKGLREDSIIIENGNAKFTLADICKAHGEGVFTYNLLKQSAYSQYYDFPNSYLASKELGSVPSDYSYISSDNEKVLIPKGSPIYISSFPGMSDDSYVELLTQDLLLIIGNEICKVIDTHKPDAIFWYYDEKNLLPAKIHLNKFIEDPDLCIPLKHMFNLAGTVDIKTEVLEATSTSDTGLRNLLNRVARSATKHLRNTWREYEGIEFMLSPNGEYVDAVIQDLHNTYAMESRSDGFKQFATFLLMISARVLSNKLENTLLLIDEPGINLHPGGCKYLRNELISISKSNYVVFSTHSIFMVDRDNLEKHLIVRKEKEITSVEEVNSSNYINEEVIYNAMGHSIFADLKKTNIVFEGWRDTKLFQVALSHIPRKYSGINKLKNIGVTYTHGAKEIKNFTPLLKLGDRECIIVSDSDQTAREAQIKYQSENGYGRWFRYDELIPGFPCKTEEDFIDTNAFVPIMSKIREKYKSLPDLPTEELSGDKGKIDILVKWLENGKIEKEKKRHILDEIKSEVFNNLSPGSINKEYYEMLVNLTANVFPPN